MKRLGFSLLELMVVIAITAILAAVAMPIYQQQKLRSLLTKKIDLGFKLLDKAVLVYQTTGVFPDTVKLAAETANKNGHWQCAYTAPEGIAGWFYQADDSAGTIMLKFRLNDLFVIPNYVSSNCNPGGAGYCVLSVGAVVTKDIVKKACGKAPYANEDIPLGYLPASCQCSNFGTFLSTGSCP